ncbi:hypothetical protein Tsubulata_039012 [Turnera subulata]|uniref:CW-type domain-containing protein n=1 Tax=Turnera subulata TaxID=218843 RepID=A0A9Q0FQA3_9ROSI|nr:hypothetical protein Tsubulata_039012 [Turnera subulata]
MQNSTVSLKQTLSVKLRHASICDPSPEGKFSCINNLVTFRESSKNVSEGIRVKVEVRPSNQRTSKVRLKMSAENALLTQKNAAIYCDLGLDMSPSSSREPSPSEWRHDSPGSAVKHWDSPSHIIKSITCFPIPNGAIVSPLHNDLLHLSGGKDSHNHVETLAQSVQEKSSVSIDEKVSGEDESEEEPNRRNHNGLTLAVHGCLKKEENIILKSKDMTSNSWNRLPEYAITRTSEMPSSIVGNEVANMVETRTEMSSQRACNIYKMNAKILSGTVVKDQKVGSDRGAGFSNKCCEMPEDLRDCRGRTINATREEFETKTESLVQNDTKVPPSAKQPSSVDKVRPEESQDYRSSAGGKRNVTISVSLQSKDRVIHDNCIPSKDNSDVHLWTPRKLKGFEASVVANAKLRRNVPTPHLLQIPIEEKKKRKFKLEVSQKGPSASGKESKQILAGKDARLLSAANHDLIGNLSDVTSIAVSVPNKAAPVVIQENWVCCDKCQKWRLLPYGTNPDQLPKKWICNMLYWLPGMNQCTVTEEETTNALNALYQVPNSLNRNSEKHYPDDNASCISFLDEQQDLVRIPQDGFLKGKKKLGSQKTSFSAQGSASNKLMNSMMKSEQITNLPKTSQNQPSLDMNLEKQHGTVHSSDVKRLKEKRRCKTDREDPKLSKKPKRDEMLCAVEYYSDSGLAKETGLSNSKYRKHASASNLRCAEKDYTMVSGEISKNMVQKVMAMDDQDKEDISGKKERTEDLHLGNHPRHGIYLKNDYPAKETKARKNKHAQHPYASEGNCKSDGKDCSKNIFLRTSMTSSVDISSYQQDEDNEDGPSKKNEIEDVAQLTVHNKSLIRRGLGGELQCMPATSSSSMNSHTCKLKTNSCDVNGSHVESVCSPLGILDQHSRKTLKGKENGGEAGQFHHLTSQRRCSGEKCVGISDWPEMVRNGKALPKTRTKSIKSPISYYRDKVMINRECDKLASTDHCCKMQKTLGGSINMYGSEPSDKNHPEDDFRLDVGPCPLNPGNATSSQTKEKHPTPVSGSHMVDIDISDSPTGEQNFGFIEPESEKKFDDFTRSKQKSWRNHRDKDDKAEKRLSTHKISATNYSHDISKADGHIQFEGSESPRRKMQNICCKDSKSTSPCNALKRHNIDGSLEATAERGKPLYFCVGGNKSENRSCKGKNDSLVVGSTDSQQFGANEGRNGLQNIRSRNPPVPDKEATEIAASNYSRQEKSSLAADCSSKEAKNLKHSAYDVKISGSENTDLCFQAALKFLQGASCLNTCQRKNPNSKEINSAEMYDTTAKLLKVSSKFSRPSLKLCGVLHVDSPLSSASDVDNLRWEKSNTTKDLAPPQAAEDHIVLLLDFARDVNLAMEASRQSQIAFAAAKCVLEEAENMEAICSVKKVLDTGFHDTEGLLQLISLAQENISKNV